MLLPQRVIGIGASAGGVKALNTIVEDLPGDLPAAVFVVVHVASDYPSMLPEILNRAGALPAAHATDREPIRPGRIYVAPPDRHVLVQGARVRVTRGPREHGHRPAVDPLFRSMAASYGSGAVGMVLTGSLDDGSAGLRSIVEEGGLAIVQSDPEHPDMPRNASAAVQVHYRTPLANIAQLLTSIASAPLHTTIELPAPEPDPWEAQAFEELHTPSGFTCPECGGSLAQSDDEPLRFRCRVGHAYAPETLMARQDETVESSLWVAVRVLDERRDLLERISSRMSDRGHISLADHFRVEAQNAAEEASRIRKLLVESSLAREPRPVDLFDEQALIDEAMSGAEDA